MPRRLRVASLFTGCGGLDLGLMQAGHEIVFQCEIDKACIALLQLQFMGTLLHQDITSLATLPPNVDLVAAGFPCIDVSIAGNRLGAFGPRTGLWLHIIRLLRDAKDRGRPVEFVLLENVPGLLFSYRGERPAIDHVVEKLEELGYSVAWRTIDAAAFGKPMRRRRVFIFASLHSDPRDVLLSKGTMECLGGCCPSSSSTPLLAQQPSSSTSPPRAADLLPCYECFKEDVTEVDFVVDMSRPQPVVPGICPTFTAANIDRLKVCLAEQGTLGGFSITSAEIFQGFTPGWTARLSDSPDWTSRDITKDRARMLGNAVSVDVARWIGEQLSAPGKYVPCGSADLQLEERHGEAFLGWPYHGWIIEGQGRFKVELSEYPVKTPLCPLRACVVVDEIAPETLKAEVSGYLNRCQAKGWKVGELKKQVKACGVGLGLLHQQPAQFVQVNRLVWGKMRSHPWWPGEVYPGDSPFLLLRTKKNGGQVFEASEVVCFFGDSNYADAAGVQMVEYEGLQSWPGKGSIPFDRPAYRDALVEAETARALRDFQRSDGQDNGPFSRDLVDKEFMETRYLSSSRYAGAANRAAKEIKCLECRGCSGEERGGCIKAKVHAAALSGHAGAAISLQGEAAVGKQIRVFWRNDNKFYKAIVTAFRPSDWSHRLQYPFDGEQEWNQLFRPMVFVAPGDGEVGEEQGQEEVAAFDDGEVGRRRPSAPRRRYDPTGGDLSDFFNSRGGGLGGGGRRTKRRLQAAAFGLEAVEEPQAVEAVPTAMEEDRNDRIHRNREHLRSLLSSSSAPGSPGPAARRPGRGFTHCKHCEGCISVGCKVCPLCKHNTRP